MPPAVAETRARRVKGTSSTQRGQLNDARHVRMSRDTSGGASPDCLLRNDFGYEDYRGRDFATFAIRDATTHAPPVVIRRN
jgi:hypothetical protein